MKMSHPEQTSEPETIRETIVAWLNGTVRRRQILPAHIVLVVAVAGAFYLFQDSRDADLQRQEDIREIEAQDRVDQCLNAVERSEGLRFNLNEIYDVIDFTLDEVEVQFEEVEQDDLDVVRQRIVEAREEIDRRYPVNAPAACIGLEHINAD